jgi:beta-galactosidase
MDRLSAPVDYSGAAVVHVDLPESAADRTLLRVVWTGDVARAYAGEQLIGDHFWHGRPWDIDVTSLRSVRLEFLPWRRATGVWVDPAVRWTEDGVAVETVTLIRVGETRLTIEEDS